MQLGIDQKGLEITKKVNLNTLGPWVASWMLGNWHCGVKVVPALWKSCLDLLGSSRKYGNISFGDYSPIPYSQLTTRKHILLCEKTSAGDIPCYTCVLTRIQMTSTPALKMQLYLHCLQGCVQGTYSIQSMRGMAQSDG